MSHLLVTLTANKFLNRTMFKQKLLIYDDKMIYRTRNLIRVKEVTTSFNHISQVFLTKGIIFATLQIINTGGLENITIKHVKKGDAVRAKDIIDKKVHSAHAKATTIDSKEEVVSGVEKSLNRLKELHQKGRITDKEYRKRKEEVLKKIY